jgi:hypothetical protein
MYPETVAEQLADHIDDYTVDEIMDHLIREKYSLTDGPGRRSMKYCLRCNPHLNGSDGQDGTEAVGIHVVPDIPDQDQFFTGREGVCERCAQDLMSHDNHVTPKEGFEDLEIFQDEEPINC